MGLFGQALYVESSSGTIVFIGVLLFLLMFEGLVNVAETASIEYGYQELVHKLFREFMIMGIISFATFAAFEAEDYSEDKWFEAFHFAHVVIFFIAIVFVFQASFLILLISSRNNTLLKFTANSSERLLNKYDRMMHQGGWQYHLFHYGPLLIPYPQLRENIEYKIIEDYFINVFNLPPEFNFGIYVTRLLKNYIISLVEVRPLNWLILSVFVALNFVKIVVIDKASGLQPHECQQGFSAKGRRLAGASLTTECVDYLLEYAITIQLILILFYVILLLISELYMRRLLGKVLDREESLIEEAAGAMDEDDITAAGSAPGEAQTQRTSDSAGRQVIERLSRTNSPLPSSSIAEDSGTGNDGINLSRKPKHSELRLSESLAQFLGQNVESSAGGDIGERSLTGTGSDVEAPLSISLPGRSHSSPKIRGSKLWAKTQETESKTQSSSWAKASIRPNASALAQQKADVAGPLRTPPRTPTKFSQVSGSGGISKISDAALQQQRTQLHHENVDSPRPGSNLSISPRVLMQKKQNLHHNASQEVMETNGSRDNLEIFLNMHKDQQNKRNGMTEGEDAGITLVTRRSSSKIPVGSLGLLPVSGDAIKADRAPSNITIIKKKSSTTVIDGVRKVSNTSILDFRSKVSDTSITSRFSSTLLQPGGPISPAQISEKHDEQLHEEHHHWSSGFFGCLHCCMNSIGIEWKTDRRQFYRKCLHRLWDVEIAHRQIDHQHHHHNEKKDQERHERSPSHRRYTVNDDLGKKGSHDAEEATIKRKGSMLSLTSSEGEGGPLVTAEQLYERAKRRMSVAPGPASPTGQMQNQDSMSLSMDKIAPRRESTGMNQQADQYGGITSRFGWRRRTAWSRLGRQRRRAAQRALAVDKEKHHQHHHHHRHRHHHHHHRNKSGHNGHGQAHGHGHSRIDGSSADAPIRSRSYTADFQEKHHDEEHDDDFDDSDATFCDYMLDAVDYSWDGLVWTGNKLYRLLMWHNGDPVISSDEDIATTQRDMRDSIFITGSALMYYITVEFALLSQCVFVALWATNFVKLAMDSSKNGMWQFLMGILILISLLIICQILYFACMLKATTSLDTDVSDSICELAIDERNVTQRLRKTLRNKLASLDLEDEDMWETFLAMQWDLFVDKGSKGVNIDGFKRFLHSIQIYLSHSSVERIFSVVDFDQDGIVRWVDVTTIVFPEMAKLRRDEYALAYNARLGITYEYDYEYQYDDEDEDEEFYYLRDEVLHHELPSHVQGEVGRGVEKGEEKRPSIVTDDTEDLNNSEGFIGAEEAKDTDVTAVAATETSQKAISDAHPSLAFGTKPFSSPKKRVSVASPTAETKCESHNVAHRRASATEVHTAHSPARQDTPTRQGTVARRASTITGSKAAGDFRPAIKRGSMAMARERNASADKLGGVEVHGSRSRTKSGIGQGTDTGGAGASGHALKRRSSHCGESFARLLHEKQEHINEYYQDSLQAAIEAEENKSVSSSSSSYSSSDVEDVSPSKQGRKKSIATSMLNSVFNSGSKRRAPSGDNLKQGNYDATDNV
jgi:hypothetical protein